MPENIRSSLIRIDQRPDSSVAEYALRDTRKPMGVTGFTVTEALPKELKGSLPTVDQIEREMDKVSTPFRSPSAKTAKKKRTKT